MDIRLVDPHAEHVFQLGAGGVRVLFRQGDRRPQQQTVLVLRVLLQHQLSLFKRLVRQSGGEEYLPQLDLCLQVARRQLDGLGEIAEGILQVPLFHFHQTEHVVSVSELGVDLQGVPELQPGLDQFALFIECLALVVELHLLCFRAAAADEQQEREKQAETADKSVIHGKPPLKAEYRIQNEKSESRSQESEFRIKKKGEKTIASITVHS